MTTPIPTDPSSPKLLITGASGVLGRACLKTFLHHGINAIGTAYTRSTSTLVSLNLLDDAALTAFLHNFKPDFVVHCAAERRPDAAAADPDKARAINSHVPLRLASLSRELGYRLVYISTDYVFDGQSPPYKPTDTPNPLQFYGVTKREGEVAVLENSDGIVVRVPLLYGEVEYNAETAVNVLLDVVQSGKITKMDAYQSRLPTSVDQVSLLLLQLVRKYPISASTPLPPIVHFSSKRPLTKYDMCAIMGATTGRDISHIIEDKEEPKGDVVRPKDTTLDMIHLQESWGLEWSDEEGGFEGWWKRYLADGRLA